MENFGGDDEAFEAAVKEYITTVIQRYKGRVVSWDVINEAFDDERGALRNSVFRRRMGDDYIARLFRYAREADPDLLLFYNDYGAHLEPAQAPRRGEDARRLPGAGHSHRWRRITNAHGLRRPASRRDYRDHRRGGEARPEAAPLRTGCAHQHRRQPAILGCVAGKHSERARQGGRSRLQPDSRGAAFRHYHVGTTRPGHLAHRFLRSAGVGRSCSMRDCSPSPPITDLPRRCRRRSKYPAPPAVPVHLQPRSAPSGQPSPRFATGSAYSTSCCPPRDSGSM